MLLTLSSYWPAQNLEAPTSYCFRPWCLLCKENHRTMLKWLYITHKRIRPRLTRNNPPFQSSSTTWIVGPCACPTQTSLSPKEALLRELPELPLDLRDTWSPLGSLQAPRLLNVELGIFHQIAVRTSLETCVTVKLHSPRPCTDPHPVAPFCFSHVLASQIDHLEHNTLAMTALHTIV